MNTMQTITAAAIGIALATSAMAVDFTDTASVVSTTPNYRTVSAPRQECWVEEVAAYAPQERSNTGPIVGGIAGAIIGNQVGGGNGRVAATTLGAVVGALTGERLSNGTQPAHGTQQVQRCRAVNDSRQVIDGYRVVYRYNGRNVAVNLLYDPGATVTVGVGLVGR